jgi:hypothetical protein
MPETAFTEVGFIGISMDFQDYRAHNFKTIC